jgi:hypothetical protein
MNKKLITLDEALRVSMPRMISDRSALNTIVEILQECIESNDFDVSSNIVETLTGKGDFGEFSINIHEFHGIFWVSAPDFDDDGYFLNKDEAISFAKVRYQPFIDNYLNDHK